MNSSSKFNFVWGCGQIGSNLLKFGKQTYAYTDRVTKTVSLPVAVEQAHQQAESPRAALDLMRALYGEGQNMRAAIWAAGLTTVQACEQNPSASLSMNITALLSAAHAFSVAAKAQSPVVIPTFVYLSSYAVVGSGTLANPKPASVYARHKAIGEQLLIDHFKTPGQQGNLVILRLPNVLGLSCNANSTTERLLDAMRSGELSIKVDADGRVPSRTFMDVRDVVSVIEGVSRSGAFAPNTKNKVLTFNLCPAKNTKSVLDVERIYSSVALNKPSLHWAELPKYEPRSISVPNTFQFDFTPVADSIKFWANGGV